MSGATKIGLGLLGMYICGIMIATGAGDMQTDQLKLENENEDLKFKLKFGEDIDDDCDNDDE